jgi:hypothetical protein
MSCPCDPFGNGFESSVFLFSPPCGLLLLACPAIPTIASPEYEPRRPSCLETFGRADEPADIEGTQARRSASHSCPLTLVLCQSKPACMISASEPGRDPCSDRPGSSSMSAASSKRADKRKAETFLSRLIRIQAGLFLGLSKSIVAPLLPWLDSPQSSLLFERILPFSGRFPIRELVKITHI